MLLCQSRQCQFRSNHFVNRKTRTYLSVSFVWSEWRDLNSRPYGPEPYALPNCATPRLIMTAFRNIHHLSFFCNRNEKRKRKIIDYFAYLHKTFANQYSMLYNISRDGAWCSGSTWASDSHCVGSIPIAPANANTLTCESVLFLYPPPCLHERVGIKKERQPRQAVFALSVIASDKEVRNCAHYYSKQKLIEWKNRRACTSVWA